VSARTMGEWCLAGAAILRTKEEEGQFFAILCGRLLWTASYLWSVLNFYLNMVIF